MSALPAIELAGTIGAGPVRRRRLRPGSNRKPGVLMGESVMNLEMAVVDCHCASRKPIHEIGIVGRYHD